MFGLMPWRKERKGSTSLAPRAEHPLSLFRDDLEEWFDRFFARWPALVGAGWMGEYGLDIEETDDAVIVRADAPGFEPADFDIHVTGNTLRITAEHKVPVEGKEPEVERRLHRTVTLPVAVEPEKVDAKYRHGVLELRLPRTEPTKTRKIEVVAA
jgi:HSP20 family protein